MYHRNRLVKVTDLPTGGRSYFEAELVHLKEDENPVLEIPCQKVRFGWSEEEVIHARVIGQAAPAVGSLVWVAFEGTSTIGWGTTESYSRAVDWQNFAVEERRRILGLPAEPRKSHATC